MESFRSGMNNVISFLPGSQLCSYNLSDLICYSVRPLIQEILNRFAVVDDLDIAINDAARHHPQLAEKFFDIDLDNAGKSFSLKNEYLLFKQTPWLKLLYKNAKYLDFLGKRGVKVFKKKSELTELHQLLYLCGRSCLTYDRICSQISDSSIELLDKFIQCSIVGERPRQVAAIPPKTPGIFRLQHASLLYRTETTGILVDPHLHSKYGNPQLKNDITRAQLEKEVDAILISHSHYDHWHYPTLMMFSPETLIVVPKVPQGTIVCEDMEARLKSLGFENVVAVDWNAEPIVVGDIRINVLPFYGEQPLVPEYNQFKHPDLRNWGNTYLIDTQYYTSWFLIDAGSDPMGSMVEVAEDVKQKFGKVDFIVSNFQPLSYNSINADLLSEGIDIIANLLSNPQILAVTNKAEGKYLATLGPKGVAEICAIVDAKCCFPYADSWSEIGQPGVHDRELIEQTEQELKKIQCTTKVVSWKIGDGYISNSQQKPLISAFR